MKETKYICDKCGKEMYDAPPFKVDRSDTTFYIIGNRIEPPIITDFCSVKCMIGYFTVEEEKS